MSESVCPSNRRSVALFFKRIKLSNLIFFVALMLFFLLPLFAYVADYIVDWTAFRSKSAFNRTTTTDHYFDGTYLAFVERDGLHLINLEQQETISNGKFVSMSDMDLDRLTEPFIWDGRTIYFVGVRDKRNYLFECNIKLDNCRDLFVAELDGAILAYAISGKDIFVAVTKTSDWSHGADRPQPLKSTLYRLKSQGAAEIEMETGGIVDMFAGDDRLYLNIPIFRKGSFPVQLTPSDRFILSGSPSSIFWSEINENELYFNNYSFENESGCELISAKNRSVMCVNYGNKYANNRYAYFPADIYNSETQYMSLKDSVVVPTMVGEKVVFINKKGEVKRVNKTGDSN